MSNKTSKKDMQMIRSFTSAFLNNPAAIPISYQIGAQKYSGIPAEFAPAVRKRFIDSNIIEHVFSGKDPATGIEITVECQEYLDYPVVEWVTWLSNPTDVPTPVVSELIGMDSVLPGKDPVVVHCNGDTCTDVLYTTSHSPLAEGELELSPINGYSSDGASPYGQVLCEGMGYQWAVGWSGKWNARFLPVDGGFRLVAKQHYTAFRIRPGEKVRTPRMTIMTFDGDGQRGQNLWRRWMFAHVVPKPNGALIPPTRSGSLVPSDSSLFDTANEENQVNGLRSLAASGVAPENFWIDAGWYTCRLADGTDDWHYVGIWDACPNRFPNGLKPVGDTCRELNMNLLVWFEPERVMLPQDTCPFPKEYLLWIKDHEVMKDVHCEGLIVRPQGAMYNLGNPDACDWLINYLDSLIKDYGITIYRQDFNFPPLQWWMQNEESDRQGINENLHVQGLHRLWDELLLRNPGLWINSVAAGGRRCDLEILRRSVPLHLTDYAHGVHPVTQALRAFGAAWMPYFGTFSAAWYDDDGNYTVDSFETNPEMVFDSFVAHNVMNPSFNTFILGAHCAQLPDGEYARTEEGQCYLKYTELWRRAAPLMLETDFYVLKLTDRTPECWHAIQYHREETGEGFIQAIRNCNAPEESIVVYPHAVDPDKTYQFEAPEFGLSKTVSGRELMEKGFEVAIPKRTGVLWFYKAV